MYKPANPAPTTIAPNSEADFESVFDCFGDFFTIDSPQHRYKPAAERTKQRRETAWNTLGRAAFGVALRRALHVEMRRRSPAAARRRRADSNHVQGGAHEPSGDRICQSS